MGGLETVKQNELFPWINRIPRVIIEHGSSKDATDFKELCDRASTCPPSAQFKVSQLNGEYQSLLIRVNNRINGGV